MPPQGVTKALFYWNNMFYFTGFQSKYIYPSAISVMDNPSVGANWKLSSVWLQKDFIEQL